MKNEKKMFVGVVYGRGGCEIPSNTGCELAPREIQKMFNENPWVVIEPSWDFDLQKLQADRFGENFAMQQIIYNTVSKLDAQQVINHIFVGGDHSVNFSHFKAIADATDDNDLCLVYVDAHFDIHTPESSKSQASGSPHGTNVRQLLGDGDDRYLGLGVRKKPLKAENVFYLGVRSYEPAELEFVKNAGIYFKSAEDLKDMENVAKILTEIKQKIGDKKYIISFDFDAFDVDEFDAIQVPELDGLSLRVAEFILDEFNAGGVVGVEFVEYAPLLDRGKKSAKIVKRLIEKFI